MKKERKTLHKLLIALGLWIIVIDLLCPFPPVLGISGLIWRTLIGIVCCLLIAVNILKLYRTDRKDFI